MKITEFDRGSVDVVCATIEESLKGAADRLGVRITLGKVGYQTRTCTIALEVTTIAAGNEGLSKAAEDFKLAASFFGLTPEHLGQTFRDEHGLRFKLVGLNLKARKRPFIIADVTGKEYVCGEDTVLRGFGVPPRKDEAAGKALPKPPAGGDS
jgi:hypothetical protein